MSLFSVIKGIVTILILPVICKLLKKGYTIPMEDLFKKIYDEVICYEKDIKEMNKTIEKENLDILKRYNNQLGTEEKEKLLELIDNASSFAVHEGFYMGIKYAFKSMVKLFND